MLRKLAIVFIIGSAAGTVHAQGDGQQPLSPTFTVGGQIRYRGEVDGKAFVRATESIAFHLLRARIGARFQPTPDVTAFVQIQDARVFGSEDPGASRGTMDGTADALDVHQAYFSVSGVFGTPLGVKVGRQKLSYGNGRLVGSADWGKTGRTFDAGKVTYENEFADVALFGARLVSHVNTSVSQNLYGAFSTLTFGPILNVDAFALHDNNTEKIASGASTGKPELARNTAGTRLFGELGRAHFELESIYQWGHEVSEQLTDRIAIRASLVGGEIGYTFPVRDLRLSVLYARLSGDGNPNDSSNGAFNTLFASNHGLYGTMDYFPGVAPAAGLRDVGIVTEAAVAKTVTLSAELHHFESAVPIETANGALSFYGREVDVNAELEYNQSLSVSGGASVFWPGDAMKALRGGRVSHWVHLSTTVNF